MEESRERRERLKELRKSLMREQSNGDAPAQPLQVHLSQPAYNNLKALKKDAAVSETLEDEAKELHKDLPQDIAATEPLELNNLVPRKPGFDLARELENRSERLEQETSYCIAELIRRRLKEQREINLLSNSEAQFDELDD
ncbi:hypothetical protein BC829DRAFT_393100 [Chytridium lagenaria]|nr:hypothetical protein BC829DRAFT_393100 [Chytridium lagenaria]